MANRLGHRCIMGLVVPSVNTTMQPECEALRPVGVTNQVSRFLVNNVALQNASDFDVMMKAMPREIEPAVEMIATCNPNHIIVGVSTDSMPNAFTLTQELKTRFEEQSQCNITMATDACVEALRALKGKRLGIISPYLLEPSKRASDFFSEQGFEVINHKPIISSDPLKFAEVTENTVFSTLDEVDDDKVDVLFQIGTNLSTAFMATEIEQRYSKPFISVNIATYWSALRSVGINDKASGFGLLLEQH